MQLLSLICGWSVLLSSVQSSFAFAPAATVLSTAAKTTTATTTTLNVASVEIPPVSEMERGVGGRIEEAFAAAKEKGEAAFVTFVTAGYPTADGKKLNQQHSFFGWFGWISIWFLLVGSN